MRFHEFYRFVGGQIVEVQAIWDIPELMMQANAWPMVPSLVVNGIPLAQSPKTDCWTQPIERIARISAKLMCYKCWPALVRHPAEPVEAMELERFWHLKMTWYGPAGIGTARGISGFRHWHQIPFLNAMPDRGQFPDETTFHFFRRR